MMIISFNLIIAEPTLMGLEWLIIFSCKNDSTMNINFNLIIAGFFYNRNVLVAKRFGRHIPPMVGGGIADLRWWNYIN